jgi:hypothetical protein
MNIVWFNGPSAADMYHIPQCQEIGCNFISDRRSVQHVCVYDREVINRIKPKAGVSYWTRKHCVDQTFALVQTDYKYSCSGTMAVQLAKNLGWDDLYIIGCDWHLTDRSVFDDRYRWRSSPPRKVNNVRIKIIESLGRDMSITHVSDSPPIFAGIKKISKRDFLDSMC